MTRFGAREPAHTCTRQDTRDKSLRVVDVRVSPVRSTCDLSLAPNGGLWPIEGVAEIGIHRDMQWRLAAEFAAVWARPGSLMPIDSHGFAANVPDAATGTASTNVPVPVIGRVALTVHDLAGVGDFYQQVIGLPRLDGDAEHLLLGHRGRLLLELRRDAAARVRSSREAGLFHTAFLLPSRADLGAWLSRAAAQNTRLDGASDHAVSEAVYLHDPEGNGVEIYADRPAETWPTQDGLIAMSTARLDVPDLLAQAAGQPWRGAPARASIGHVHLQVGALEPAQIFYQDTLKLDVTCRYPGALFYSVGGYHHHVATNIWNSRDAGPRDLPSTGLTELELRLPAVPAGTLVDPWGTAIRVVATREP